MRSKNTAITIIFFSLFLALVACQQKPEQKTAKVEKQPLYKEPAFPGGTQAWARYITEEIEKNLDALSEENVSGTVVVSFTVDTSGKVINPRVMSCCESPTKNCANPDSKLAQVAVEALRHGPRWEPAIAMDGKAVKFVKQQPVTFKLETVN